MVNERSITKQRKIDEKYLRIAKIWSENSHAQRSKVGAILVKDEMIISDGYNGTPKGFDNCCEDENNHTLPEVLHAESNCLMKLVRTDGPNAQDGTLYVTLSPCIECAKLIIQAGIKRVVYGEKYRILDGIKLLKKAGVQVVYIDFNTIKHDED